MIRNNGQIELFNLSKVSPLLVLNGDINEFKGVLEINAKIDSKELGITNSKTGIIMPMWLQKVMLKKNIILAITDLESISFEEQEKFYELLKYKTISSFKLPLECKIIVLANDLSKISKTILSLCQVLN